MDTQTTWTVKAGGAVLRDRTFRAVRSGRPVLVREFAAIARFSRGFAQLGIRFSGHANDGWSGRPRAPIDDVPF